MPEQLHEASDRPTEIVRYNIPRLGLFGEVEVPVMDTKVEGPGMDGAIVTDSRSSGEVPFNIPRVGFRETTKES